MKIARTVALSVLLIGLGACASYSGDRYYVPGNEQGGDYYYAPAPRDDYNPDYYGGFGWGAPYGGFCPWAPFDCWSPYGGGYDFSFGFSYGPWWDDSRHYRYAPRPPRDRQPLDTPPWTDPQDNLEPRRRDRSSHDTRPDLPRNEPPPMRMDPADPEPAPSGRERERHSGRPPGKD